MPSRSEFVAVCMSHLGEPGPMNTCLSNGVQKWAGEAGLPQLGNDTATVSVYRNAAKQLGYYHEGTAGIQPGDVCDWAFLNGIIGHVSVCTGVSADGGIQSIASGRSAGTVGIDPPGGGYNSPATIQGYITLPGLGSETQMTVNPSSNINTSSSVSGAAGLFPSLIDIANNIEQPGFWSRVGIGLLGGVLLLIALIKIVGGTDAGSKAISTGKSVAKDAVAAAVIAPK